MSENVLNPTGNKILLEIPKKTETVVGGIIIPSAARISRISDKFKILAIGPDVKEDLKVGDTIVLDSERCGILTKFNDTLYAMCKDSEVAFVLEEDEPVVEDVVEEKTEE